jgi:hypothetical protein
VSEEGREEGKKDGKERVSTVICFRHLFQK